MPPASPRGDAGKEHDDASGTPRAEAGDGWRRQATTSLLLVAVVMLVCLGFALVGGAVLPGIGSLVAWIGLGLALFLGVQIVVFRALGLRSRADAPGNDGAPSPGDDGAPSDGAPPPAAGADGEHEADWRAWRG